MKLSVIMITYGHEKYIREAINGVLSQKCNFDFELLVANDCSPDNTDAVIQDIVNSDVSASKIKYVKREKNIGMIPNFIDSLSSIKSEYIALCEGDDYWIDNYKLQKQIDALEAEKDSVLCFHKVKVLNENNEIIEDNLTNIPENYQNLETLALKGNYIHTPSVVFKNVIDTYPKEFYKTSIGDFFLYMILAEHGSLIYLKDTMAVYRYGVGVFSAVNSIKKAKANIRLFTALLSYFSDKSIKEIFLKRQEQAISNLEHAVAIKEKEDFYSKHYFLKFLKIISENYKQPKKMISKLFRGKV